jgi:hypothetical protein
MHFISHRGNITRANRSLENSVGYILSALNDYDVEIDVWLKNNCYYLGHDGPSYLIEPEFLKTQINEHKFWCHAKNITVFERLISLGVICFFHQNDDITPTIPHHYLWTFPGKELTASSVCVMPEIAGLTPEKLFAHKIAGVCSDQIQDFRNYFLNCK